jgi:hypothetical protein
MKTAVEWLVEQMIKYELLPKSIHPDSVLFHKAKEMEKQQIIKANEENMMSFTDGEQYYNETFNKGQ